VLVVEGRFPMEQLRPFLKETPRRYRDADVYRINPGDVTTFAVIQSESDGSILLLGDEKSVLAAIDRRGGALAPASPLLRRAQALAATHDFWLIADGPLTGPQPKGAAPGNALAMQMAGQVKGLDMGLALHDGFRLEAGVTAENDAAAAQMTEMLQMALLSQANNPQAAEIARKLHIGSQGNRMQLSITLTKDEFDQQLRVAQAARAQTAASSFTPATPSAARPVQPAHPGHIVIYGLDDGPRVIQTTH
jgi:hypothetical protein